MKQFEKFRQPIKMYFCWSEKFQFGHGYADFLYSKLSRCTDVNQQTGIGIPIDFLVSPETIISATLNNEAIQTIVCVFIDAEFIIDQRWVKSIEMLIELKKTSFQIIPIAFHENAFNVSSKISAINAIRMYDLSDDYGRRQKLLMLISYEICRNLKGISLNTDHSKISIPLFLSHAKIDGEETAKKIRNYISQETQMTTFFDENNIPYGEEFEFKIEKEIAESVVIVIHTDKYSTREMCRKEFLLAKKLQRPIVVLESLTIGEERSFPYFGNVKTIVYSQKINYMVLLGEILIETCRKMYYELSTSYVVKVMNLDKRRFVLFPYPPELLTLLLYDGLPRRTVLYPEPPLGNEEVNIICKIAKVKYATPLLFAIKNKNHQMAMYNKTVAISSSEPLLSNECLNMFNHIRECILEIGRYIFACGGTISYGGTLQKFKAGNILEDLITLAKMYNNETKYRTTRIMNYYFDLDTDIPKNANQMADYINVMSYSNVGISHIGFKNEVSIPQRTREAAQLSHLRSRIAEDASAIVFIGGKTSGYSGIVPGILEEFLYGLDNKKPLFLLGGFGGATEEIINILNREKSLLSEEEQVKNENYKAFISEFNNLVTDDKNKIDYSKVETRLRNIKFGDLNNGLSFYENKALFKTQNLYLILALVMKGLANRFSTL